MPKHKDTQAVANRIHDFLVGSYGAYTRQHGSIRGIWLLEGSEVSDLNVRYEVSFKGKERIPQLVAFLSDLCRQVGEKAIYLTMGEESYLVKPSTLFTPFQGPKEEI